MFGRSLEGGVVGDPEGRGLNGGLGVGGPDGVEDGPGEGPPDTPPVRGELVHAATTTIAAATAAIVRQARRDRDEACGAAPGIAGVYPGTPVREAARWSVEISPAGGGRSG
jgi:hypothetical protein